MASQSTSPKGAATSSDLTPVAIMNGVTWERADMGVLRVVDGPLAHASPYPEAFARCRGSALCGGRACRLQHRL